MGKSIVGMVILVLALVLLGTACYCPVLDYDEFFFDVYGPPTTAMEMAVMTLWS